MTMDEPRHHRGSDPRDQTLFSPQQLPLLQEAVTHLCWLLSRGYAPDSSRKLVGDRFRLRTRQREAVGRSSCSDAARADRQQRQRSLATLADRTLHVDGFNVLTTLEAAIAGSLVLEGRDGCLRDLAGVHGQHRPVAETRPALAALTEVLREAKVGALHWWLDRPVPHSGRMRVFLEDFAAEHRLDWQVTLAQDPDRDLCACEDIVVSADRRVLDGCRQWCNLARHTVEAQVPDAWWLDLSGGPT